MKKANPTTIGLFLIVGVALGVAGVLMFNSEILFHPKYKTILYFDGSLKGLSQGAPVEFRGVTVGKVDQILIHHNQASDDFSMPVIIAIDTKLAQSKSDEKLEIGNPAHMELLVREGFRARLDADSLVTGVLFVSLEVDPHAPPPVYHQLKPEYSEIPTIPSHVQQLLANLERLDLPGISDKVNAVLGRLDAGLAQINFAQLNSGMTNLLGSANKVITTPELTNAIVSARKALDRAQTLLKRVDGRVDPLADSLTNTLLDAQLTLADLRRGIQNLSGIVGPDTSFRPDLTQALEQLGNASRAVADLAEFLQRNPNALVTGRKRQEP